MTLMGLRDGASIAGLAIIWSDALVGLPASAAEIAAIRAAPALMERG